MVIRVQLLFDVKNGALQIEVPNRYLIGCGQLDLLCHCGERNIPESSFCGQCGESLRFASRYTTKALEPFSSPEDESLVPDDSYNDEGDSNSCTEETADALMVLLPNISAEQVGDDSALELIPCSSQKLTLTDHYENTMEPNQFYQECQISEMGDSVRRIIHLLNMLKHSYNFTPAVIGTGINNDRLRKLSEFQDHLGKLYSAITTLLSQEFKMKLYSSRS